MTIGSVVDVGVYVVPVPLSVLTPDMVQEVEEEEEEEEEGGATHSVTEVLLVDKALD